METKNSKEMTYSGELYVKTLKATNMLCKEAVCSAIKDMSLFDNAKVLDVPCGIGNQTLWMLQNNPKINITSVDFGKKQIKYAKNLISDSMPNANCKFIQEDINKLNFKNNSFDFVWCCDGLWVGSKETGCLAEKPDQILQNFIRMTKPNGKIVVLFWSSQKLLIGYPYIESALNNTRIGNQPMQKTSNPELHILNAGKWLKKAGLKNIKINTYISNLHQLEDKNALQLLFPILYGTTQHEVSSKIWQTYHDLINPSSKNCVFNSEEYSGFITYSVFVGEVEK